MKWAALAGWLLFAVTIAYGYWRKRRTRKRLSSLVREAHKLANEKRVLELEQRRTKAHKKLSETQRTTLETVNADEQSLTDFLSTRTKPPTDN